MWMEVDDYADLCHLSYSVAAACSIKLNVIQLPFIPLLVLIRDAILILILKPSLSSSLLLFPDFCAAVVIHVYWQIVQ